jgi:hypothetical protein
VKGDEPWRDPRRGRVIVLAIGLTALTGLVARELPVLIGFVASEPNARAADHRHIRSAYESARAAHFQHDATAFLANNDVRWYVVADGSFALRTPADERPAVQEYFDSVKFVDISDLDPPHIEVSSDGRMAWLLGHVRVHGTRREAKGTEVPLDFDAAWIDVWEKKEGVWRIVARANTEKDSTPNR